MPKETVDSIVTPRILKMDKASCDNLLKNLLEEKIKEDEKKEIIKQEKIISRNKLVFNHNIGLEKQEKLGIKIASTTPRKGDESIIISERRLNDDGFSFADSQVTLENDKYLGTRITQPS
jgi:hypothetical protein